MLKLRNEAIITAILALVAIVGFRNQITKPFSRLVSLMTPDKEAPIDQEIDDINVLIGNLLPDIREQMIRVAKAKTKLKRSVDIAKAREAELKVCRQELKRVHDGAKSGEGSTVRLGDRAASEEEIKAELNRLLNVAQLLEDTLQVENETAQSDRSILSDEESALKLLTDRRQEMVVQVANFRARLASVKSKQSISPSREQDQLVDQCQEKVEEVQARLEVAEQLLAIQGQFTARTPPEQPLELRSGDVFSDVERYFQTRELIAAGKITREY